MIQNIRAIYKDTHFFVNDANGKSENQPQERGIRQGCPLSPYLFIAVTSTMFREVHAKLPRLPYHRADNATFDELLYADDTILISKCTRMLNRFLSEVESAALSYGLKLNKTKCKCINMGPPGDVKFADGTRVQKATNRI